MRTMINKTDCSVPCNLCESTTVKELCLKDRKGGNLRTIICKKCGLIWTDPRPAEYKIKEFYSNGYRREYKGIYKPELKHIYRDAKRSIRRFNFLKEVIEEGNKILDIGSGTGAFLYTLRKLGLNATGIEPNEGYASYSREELSVPVQVCVVQNIEENNPFDIITLHHVLEHVTDPFGVLRKIWKLLKINAYLMVEVPNAENITQDPKNRYHKAHLYTFNPETLESIGKKSGFEVYKKSIASFNGNITIIFRKTKNFNEISGILSGNYKKITKTLNKHTRFHHFTTPTPYKKIIKKISSTLYEEIFLKKFNKGKDIIDILIAKEIS